MQQPLTKQTFTQFFQGLGIEKGSRLVVHSALRSLGAIEGGADTVLDALLDCIGEEGLLVMPTFTYFNETFDPTTEPSKTGALSEVMRKRPNAVRSLHPSHSVTAIGNGAFELCEGHHMLPGLGVDSPLDRVAKAGGGILLLGVGHTSNSTVHVGEAYAKVPYLDIPFRPDSRNRVPLIGDFEMEVEIKDPPGCSRAFGTIEAALRTGRAISDGILHKSLIQWMPGQVVIDAAVNILRSDPAALLCTDPSCYRCSHSRRRLGGK